MKKITSMMLITFAVALSNIWSRYDYTVGAQPHDIPFFSFTTESSPIQSDRCSDILRDGIFEKYQSLNSSNYKQKLLTSILSYREEQASGGQGGEVNAIIPIDGVPVPVGGKEASNHLKTLKEKYESNHALELEQSDLDWLEARIASREIVKAWSKCMSDHSAQRGLKAEIESIGRTRFVLKTRWDGSLGVTSVKIKDFVVSGAKCDPRILEIGKNIGSEWVSQPCVREGKESVLLTLNVVDENGRDAGTQTPSLSELPEGDHALLLEIDELRLSNTTIINPHPGWGEESRGAIFQVNVVATVKDRANNQTRTLSAFKEGDEVRNADVSRYPLNLSLPVPVKSGDMTVEFRMEIAGRKKNIYGTQTVTFTPSLTFSGGRWTGASDEWKTSSDLSGWWRGETTERWRGQIHYRIKYVN